MGTEKHSIEPTPIKRDMYTGTVEANAAIFLYYTVEAGSKKEAEAIMLARAEKTTTVEWEITSDIPMDMDVYIEEESHN
jgi:hypothetical protein